MDDGSGPYGYGGSATGGEPDEVTDLWLHPFDPRLDRSHWVRLKSEEIRLAFHKPPQTFANYITGPLLADTRLVSGLIYIKTNGGKLYLCKTTSLIQLERELPESCMRVSGTIICNRDAVKELDREGGKFRLHFGNSDSTSTDVEVVYVKRGFAAAVKVWLQKGKGGKNRCQMFGCTTTKDGRS